MKNLYLSCCVLFICSHMGVAQEINSSVIGNTGQNSAVDGYTLSWTIGEMIVASTKEDSIFLTQGFHQGDPKAVASCPNVAISYQQALTCDFNNLGLDTLTFKDDKGCDSLVIVERFFGFPQPPLLSISEDVALCTGDSIHLISSTYTTGLQWVKGDEEIAGATDTILQVTESGTYSLTYTDEEGCTVASDVINISFADENCLVNTTNLNLAHIKIYPNPMQDQLVLEWQDDVSTSPMVIKLFDETGRQLQEHILEKQKQYQQQAYVISTNDLPVGMYFISLTAHTDSKVYKVFKVE